jgi:hypothetical protein
MLMPHFITLAEAKLMTATFKARKDSILDPIFQNRDILANCETFDRTAIDAILAQPGCTQLRIYYGMDTDLKMHAILVGVDENDDDLLPEDPNDPNEQIAEMSRRCPELCPRNPL